MTALAARAPTIPAAAAAAIDVLSRLRSPAVVAEMTAPGRWRILWVNAAYVEVTGFSAEEMVGQQPVNLVGPLTEPDLLEQADHAIRLDGGLRRDVVLHAKDGRPLWCELEAGLFDQAPGEPLTGWSVLSLDAGDRFRRLVENISDVVVVLDREGVIRYASPSVVTLGNVSPDALLGLCIFDMLHPEHLAEQRAFFAEVVACAGAHGPKRVVVQNSIGAPIELEALLTNCLDDPAVHGIIVTARSLRERKRTDAIQSGEAHVLETMAASDSLVSVLQEVAALAETHLPGVRCSIGSTDADGVIRHHAAPSLPASMLALLDAEMPDSDLGAMLRRTHDAAVIVHDITTDPMWGPMGPIAHHHGLRACWWFPIRSGTGDLLGAATFFHDEARGPNRTERPLLQRVRHLAALALERGRFERRLAYQALHDDLTGLPNRSLLLERVERAVEIGERRRTHTAVLFVDLDRFKLVNDSLGHAVGDELLRQAADRLAATVRRGDTIGRFGGDEFVVVAEDVAGEAGAVLTADRLLAALTEPFTVGGASVAVSASVGIALAGPGAPDVEAETLVRNADAAMYRAKDRGRNRTAVFEDTLHDEVVRRYELEQGLRLALDHDELVVHYQPQVRLSDGRVSSVEALLRWDRPGHGLIGADEIVPIAEDTGLIVPIGARVLAEACRQARAWDADPATAGLGIAVNLSARQLTDPGLLSEVAGTLAATGLEPRRLCLEVTESALAADPERAVGVVCALKALGVRIAIDDFGTGYATLDYVRRFSMADELKIDRTFVAGLTDTRSPDAAIVSASVVLAHALGFEVVAEGVETAEQLAVVRRLGCDYAQGWYFGHAERAADCQTR